MSWQYLDGYPKLTQNVILSSEQSPPLRNSERTEGEVWPQMRGTLLSNYLNVPGVRVASTSLAPLPDSEVIESNQRISRGSEDPSSVQTREVLPRSDRYSAPIGRYNSRQELDSIAESSKVVEQNRHRQEIQRQEIHRQEVQTNSFIPNTIYSHRNSPDSTRFLRKSSHSNVHEPISTIHRSPSPLHTPLQYSFREESLSIPNLSQITTPRAILTPRVSTNSNRFPPQKNSEILGHQSPTPPSEVKKYYRKAPDGSLVPFIPVEDEPIPSSSPSPSPNRQISFSASEPNYSVSHRQTFGPVELASSLPQNHHFQDSQLNKTQTGYSNNYFQSPQSTDPLSASQSQNHLQFYSQNNPETTKQKYETPDLQDLKTTSFDVNPLIAPSMQLFKQQKNIEPEFHNQISEDFQRKIHQNINEKEEFNQKNIDSFSIRHKNEVEESLPTIEKVALFESQTNLVQKAEFNRENPSSLLRDLEDSDQHKVIHQSTNLRNSLAITLPKKTLSSSNTHLNPYSLDQNSDFESHQELGDSQVRSLSHLSTPREVEVPSQVENTRNFPKNDRLWVAPNPSYSPYTFVNEEPTPTYSNSIIPFDSIRNVSFEDDRKDLYSEPTPDFLQNQKSANQIRTQIVSQSHEQNSNKNQSQNPFSNLLMTPFSIPTFSSGSSSNPDFEAVYVPPEDPILLLPESDHNPFTTNSSGSRHELSDVDFYEQAFLDEGFKNEHTKNHLLSNRTLSNKELPQKNYFRPFSQQNIMPQISNNQTDHLTQYDDKYLDYFSEAINDPNYQKYIYDQKEADELQNRPKESRLSHSENQNIQNNQPNQDYLPGTIHENQNTNVSEKNQNFVSKNTNFENNIYSSQPHSEVKTIESNSTLNANRNTLSDINQSSFSYSFHQGLLDSNLDKTQNLAIQFSQLKLIPEEAQSNREINNSIVEVERKDSNHPLHQNYIYEAEQSPKIKTWGDVKKIYPHHEPSNQLLHTESIHNPVINKSFPPLVQDYTYQNQKEHSSHYSLEAKNENQSTKPSFSNQTIQLTPVKSLESSQTPENFHQKEENQYQNIEGVQQRYQPSPYQNYQLGQIKEKDGDPSHNVSVRSSATPSATAGDILTPSDYSHRSVVPSLDIRQISQNNGNHPQQANELFGQVPHSITESVVPNLGQFNEGTISGKQSERQYRWESERQSEIQSELQSERQSERPSEKIESSTSLQQTNEGGNRRQSRSSQRPERSSLRNGINTSRSFQRKSVVFTGEHDEILTQRYIEKPSTNRKVISRPPPSVANRPGVTIRPYVSSNSTSSMSNVSFQDSQGNPVSSRTFAQGIPLSEYSQGQFDQGNK